jgi:L-asparaginase/Glu-tRNA(Gln) amidotransferase subunit D
MPTRREFLRYSAVFPLSLTAAVSARRQTTLPKVLILATGGTIAATGSSATDLTNYRPGVLPAEELLNAVPQVNKYADVRDEQALNIVLSKPDGERPAPSRRGGFHATCHRN